MKLKSIMIVFLLTITNLFALSYDVKITEQELQQKIEKKFPFEKKKFLTKIILTNPQIKLKDGSDKIYIDIDITTQISKKISFDASAKLNGKVVYDSESKKFYLKDLSIDELVMDKVPPKFQKTIEKTIEKLAKVVLNKYHVYELKSKDFKNSMAALLLKGIKVENQTMLVTLGL